MADLDLQRVHDEMISVAYEAGAVILAADPANIDQDTKQNSADIVTETDKGVEQMVSARLSAAFPSVAFMGEETYKPGMRIGPEPTFIIDPIDGTTNFVHSFPNACISLGLAVGGVPTVGVIYNPFQDLLFTGIQGRGAYMTRLRGSTPRRLPIANKNAALTSLDKTLIAVEWGSTREGPNFETKVDVFRKLTASKATGGHMVHSLRSLGSAALNLAHVATGTVDAYWEGGCWPWDVCAGWCILVEAGGRMVGGNPGNWDNNLESMSYLAIRAAPTGQEAIVEEFWSAIGEGRLTYSM